MTKEPFEIAHEGLQQMTTRKLALTPDNHRRVFLAGNENILRTFSAGVAQLAPDETGADAIKRADQAFYLARRAGKNRALDA